MNFCMRNIRRWRFAVLCLALAWPWEAGASRPTILFGGGPAGGNFSVVAEGIQNFRPVKAIEAFAVQAEPSAGSRENLSRTDAGDQHMSVVHAGDVWKGARGRLEGDENRYQSVLAVAWLYGAPAQLVVPKGSGIRKVRDLEGKRVGVGNPGSGALANSELFFRHLGIWDKIKPRTLGYNDASTAFTQRKLDAFWLVTGFPSGSVIMAAQDRSVELLDLHTEAEASGFYQAHPFLTPVTIPPGTYHGVDRPVPSFQDSAIWVANADVAPDVVYRLLSAVYSDEGIRYMHNLKKTFQQMSLQSGPGRIVTPFHPGAEKFWREKVGAAFAQGVQAVK